MKEHHHYRYLRVRINSPINSKEIDSKSNVCKQVWIKCIELTLVTFYNC